MLFVATFIIYWHDYCMMIFLLISISDILISMMSMLYVVVDEFLDMSIRVMDVMFIVNAILMSTSDQ